MNHPSKVLFAGLLVGSLMVPGIFSAADAKDGFEDHGQHKGWSKDHGQKFHLSSHDRREFGHHGRELHRSSRWDEQRGYRRDTRYHDRFDNRGHHNKPEIRQDFKDIRNARSEVRQDRRELRKDYAELRKDRRELRRDLRNGASSTEILNDQKEIRDDLAEIARDRTELRKDQNTLKNARQELKADLHKR